MTSFRQVPPEVWPSGDGETAAYLAGNPEELQDRFGITFEEGFDDLDYYHQAMLELASGRRVVLVRYRGEVESGTAVELDSLDSVVEGCDELLAALELPATALTWKASQG